MEWVLDHLRLLIGAAGVVAWWLNQRRATKAAAPQAPKPATFNDPQLAERTRRIREEIQRKIEERARAYTRPDPTAARANPAVPPPLVRPAAERRSAAPATARVSRAETDRTKEIPAQQVALAERLREAQLIKAAARRDQVANEAGVGASSTVTIAAAGLVEDLRDPQALRRAFLLREIIGPPVALRH
jgi:hypothetical protein